MFRVRCQQSATVDVKGRLALPAPIRRAVEASGSGLVLTYGDGPVWAWAPEAYEKVEEEMMARDTFARPVLDFAYALMSSAQDVDMDKAGRIRIPPILREQAQLGSRVIVQVVLGRIEIWDKDAWDARFQSATARRMSQSGKPELA